jgi:hypothetical protein
MVKRYDTFDSIREYKDGAYVMFEDYKKLLRDYKQLRLEFESYKSQYEKPV